MKNILQLNNYKTISSPNLKDASRASFCVSLWNLPCPNCCWSVVWSVFRSRSFYKEMIAKKRKSIVQISSKEKDSSSSLLRILCCDLLRKGFSGEQQTNVIKCNCLRLKLCWRSTEFVSWIFKFHNWRKMS